MQRDSSKQRAPQYGHCFHFFPRRLLHRNHRYCEPGWNNHSRSSWFPIPQKIPPLFDLSGADHCSRFVHHDSDDARQRGDFFHRDGIVMAGHRPPDFRIGRTHLRNEIHGHPLWNRFLLPSAWRFSRSLAWRIIL